MTDRDSRELWLEVDGIQLDGNQIHVKFKANQRENEWFPLKLTAPTEVTSAFNNLAMWKDRNRPILVNVAPGAAPYSQVRIVSA